MSNGKISLMIAIAMTVLSLAAIAGGIYLGRKNKTVKTVGKRVAAVVLCLVLVLGVTANYACYAFNNVINIAFSKSTASAEETAKAKAASDELVERIEAEGVVLLENKENALPLDVADAKQANVNVFGWSSIDLIHGGGGSSSRNTGGVVTLAEGLENAGFHVNKDLVEFYQSFDYKRATGTIPGVFVYDFNIYEAPVEKYSDELLKSARDFSDVALIVLTRQGGEDGELPTEMTEWGGSADQHYLQLSDAERDMIEMVKEQGYKKIIALINTSHAMELGFLEEEGIDAALWIGGPGGTGCNAIGKVLSGEANPSGRLADTYAYDATSSPAYYNAGAFFYSNAPFTNVSIMPPQSSRDTYHSFVNYAEGIYVGYRYYETRWVDNVTGACDEAAYRAAVQYPFGYGLSYTTFEQKMGDLQVKDGTITAEVSVTNTGSVPGKDVVQLYYTAPYIVGGLEKSHVVLGAFGKTAVLEPGKSETVTLTLTAEDMASYDYAKEKSWVLDAGDYELKLMNNAHDVLDSRTYTVDSTIVYNAGNHRVSDKIDVTNQFDDVTYDGDVQYVSRADWEGTLPTERTKDKDASAELIAILEDFSVKDDPNAAPIVFKDNGLTFTDMKGVAYDDPKWELLLQQISVDEMAKLVGMGGYATQPIDSIKKPLTVEVEGPLGMNSFMNGIAGAKYPSEVVLASTFNVELAKEMGERVGDECQIQGYDGIMAPAMDIHRTPFSGRNFEYYSEDGFLSGAMGAHEVQGYNNKGVITFLKHFALNDQETNRFGVCVWANEQSIRELYFKPFEMSVKQGGSLGIMSAFNRVGTTWAGASHALLNTVLRGEWGFRGCVVSDMDCFAYQDTDQAIRAGNDLMLTLTGNLPGKETIESNAGHQALRSSTHNILYALSNSNAMDVAVKQNSSSWLLLLGAVDIIILAIGGLGLYAVTRKKKENEAV